MSEQLECRIIITHSEDGRSFQLGMYDPISARHEYLGTHPRRDIDHVVGDLKARIEREGYILTFSEVTGNR